MQKQVSPKIVSLVFAVLVVGFLAVFYVFAWTEPLVAPPGGNVPAPINVGSISQIKEGGFGVYGVFRAVGGADPAVESGLVVNNGDVGIGTPTPSTRLEIVGGPTKTTGGLIIETRTTNPATLENGRMWLCTDAAPYCE